MSDLPEKIRAFIAVRIPDSVRAQIGGVQQQLKRGLRDVSWTRPEAMHLTLQFLGEVVSARLAELETVLHDVARGQPRFELALGPLGSFGNRVIWIGLHRGEQPLKKLADGVRRVTGEFAGHEENREFSAHVTLGRIRRPTQAVNTAMRKVRVPGFEPWNATDFELIRSELSPEGSRYTTLARFELQ